MSEGYKAARPANPETPIEGAKEKLSTDEQWKKLRAVVVETTRLVEAQARDVAEDRMTESKEDRSKGWMERTATRIWKHNLFQEYYRQREIVKARGRIIESENLYIDETDAAESQHKEAVNALFDRFTSEYEEDVLRKDERESKKTVEGGDANARIEALIREYAGNREMGKEAFDEERGRIIASLDPANRTSATTYADNFFELATQARDAVEHGAKLSELDLEVSLTLGKARGALDTEAKMTTFDRAVEKLKGMPLGIGSLVTNESVVTLAAIAYAGTKGLGLGALKSNASKVATFGAGLGIATVLAGYNEAIRLRRERSQHMRERAKGKKFDSDAERRNEMEENIYDTVSARDLSASLEAQLEKARAGTLTPEEMAGTLQSLADLEARIALGEENQSDLISYSRFDQVEQERTQLVTSRGAMKTALRAQDPENFDTKLKELVQSRREALVGGEAGMEAKDQIYEKMRNRSVAKVAIRTAIVGTGFGLVAQEVGAAFDGQKDGLLEGAWKSITGNREDIAQGGTLLEGARRFIPGTGPRMPLGELHTVSVGNTTMQLPEGVDLIQNGDGSYDLLRAGDVVADNVPLTFEENGDLTQAAKELLAKEDVGATFAITEGETVTAAAYVQEHEELTHHVRRGLWYDNDTPKPTFDRNELKQWWGGENGTGIDANGNFVFSVDQMSAEGSYHGDMSVDAQERMQAGELKMLLSLSRDTQHHVFEVAIDANGNAIIPKDSEIARLMFEEVDGKAVFVGQYAEVAQDMGVAEDGAEQVRILSTVVGEGRANIDIPPVANVLLDVPDASDIEVPPFLPLPWPRRPLEQGMYPAASVMEALANPYAYREGLKKMYSKFETYRNGTAALERLEQQLKANPAMSERYAHVLKRLDAVKGYATLDQKGKEHFARERDYYNRRYLIDPPLSLEQYLTHEKSRLYRQLENIALEEAEVGGKPFEDAFYKESPGIKGIERAKEIVVYLDDPIGDAVLTVPAINALQAYITQNNLDKSIVVVTRHADLFKSLADQHPNVVVENAARATERFAKNPREERFVLNTNKDFEDYESLGFSKEQASDPSYVFSTDYAGWEAEEYPVESNKTERYYTLPARVARNMEILLGQRLFEDINGTERFIERGKDFEEESKVLREKYQILPNEKVIVMSAGSSVRPKEYEPEKWGELIQGIAEKVPNAHIIMLDDPDPKRREEYGAVADRLKATGIRIDRGQEPMSSMNTLMSMAEYVITPDTGLGQYAGAMGRRAVMLFLSDSRFWSTPGTIPVMHPKAGETYFSGRKAYDLAWKSPQEFYVKDGEEMVGASDIDPQEVLRHIRVESKKPVVRVKAGSAPSPAAE